MRASGRKRAWWWAVGKRGGDHRGRGRGKRYPCPPSFLLPPERGDRFGSFLDFCLDNDDRAREHLSIRPLFRRARARQPPPPRPPPSHPPCEMCPLRPCSNPTAVGVFVRDTASWIRTRRRRRRRYWPDTPRRSASPYRTCSPANSARRMASPAARAASFPARPARRRAPNPATWTSARWASEAARTSSTSSRARRSARGGSRGQCSSSSRTRTRGSASRARSRRSTRSASARSPPATPNAPKVSSRPSRAFSFGPWWRFLGFSARRSLLLLRLESQQEAVCACPRL